MNYYSAYIAYTCTLYYYNSVFPGADTFRHKIAGRRAHHGPYCIIHRPAAADNYVVASRAFIVVKYLNEKNLFRHRDYNIMYKICIPTYQRSRH